MTVAGRWLTPLLTAAALACCAGLSAPMAGAQGPISQAQIQAQCSVQYPALGGFSAGEAYLAAPGDAYSWRCRQTSTSSGGGVITDLAVDLNAICGGAAAVPASASDPLGWACV